MPTRDMDRSNFSGMGIEEILWDDTLAHRTRKGMARRHWVLTVPLPGTTEPT